MDRKQNLNSDRRQTRFHRQATPERIISRCREARVHDFDLSQIFVFPWSARWEKTGAQLLMSSDIYLPNIILAKSDICFRMQIEERLAPDLRNWFLEKDKPTRPNEQILLYPLRESSRIYRHRHLDRLMKGESRRFPRLFLRNKTPDIWESRSFDRYHCYLIVSFPHPILFKPDRR